jgi:hypothetical protein
MTTDLSTIVLNRCEQDQLPVDHPLRTLAGQFNEATERAIKDPVLDNSKKLLGAWARLRKEWSAYSGEPCL